MRKLYFYRNYDQWKGIDIAVENEINELCFLIQIPDLDDIDRLNEGVASFKATFEGGLGEATGVVHNKERRIVKLINIPPEILATNGLYKVTFTLSKKIGEEVIIEKTATQTFSILEAVELSEDYIKNYDRYDEITQLLEKFYEEKVIDLTMYAKTEDVEKIIEEALNGIDIDTIIAELESKGLYITSEQLTQRLTEIKKEHESMVNAYLARYATLDNLKSYTKSTDLNSYLGLYNYAKLKDLNNYVEKETDKTLTSNDFTDELKNKLENIPEQGHYDDTEIREMIDQKASISFVKEYCKDIVIGDNFYDKSYIDEQINNINDTHEEDITNIENELPTFLKKEEYLYADGINSDDVTFDEKTLTQILNEISTELLYKEIEIKNFNSTLISHLYEFNVNQIYGITLRWELNKTPIYQSINNYNGVLSENDREITINKTISSDTDFILTVIDERGIEKKSVVSLKFVFPSYYGTYNDILNVNDITSGNKIIIENKDTTINMSYTNSKIFFAYPKSFGKLIDIKDGNGLSYINDFIYDGTNFGMNGTSYNVYKLDERATVESISFSFIFEKEEE